jgi:hypothetical protein
VSGRGTARARPRGPGTARHARRRQPPEAAVAPGDPPRCRGEQAEAQPSGRRRVRVAGRQAEPPGVGMGIARLRGRQRQRLRQRVGRGQVGAAQPAGHHLLAAGGRLRWRRAARELLLRNVAGVVVPVTGQPQPYGGAGRHRGTPGASWRSRTIFRSK